MRLRAGERYAFIRGGPLSNKSDETERSSASSASRVGRRRILAESSVAMSANWDGRPIMRRSENIDSDCL